MHTIKLFFNQMSISPANLMLVKMMQLRQTSNSEILSCHNSWHSNQAGADSLALLEIPSLLHL